MDTLAAFLFLFSLIVYCSSINGEDADLIRKLINRIEALESRDKIQQGVIEEQRTLIQQQNERMENLEQMFKTPSINSQVDKPERPARLIMGDVEGPVAFHAVLEGGISDHVTTHQKIAFGTVRLNLGNAYHAAVGLFIAPSNGLYLFSVSTTSTQEAHMNLMKNDQELAGTYSSGPGLDQGSATVITNLTAGDEVYVELRRPTNTNIYGDHLSSFTGCLLMDL